MTNEQFRQSELIDGEKISIVYFRGQWRGLRVRQELHDGVPQPPRMLKVTAGTANGVLAALLPAKEYVA